MKKLTTAALVLGVASAASAQMRGSDTLFEMINDADHGVLKNCAGATVAPAMTYIGGGSSNGEGDMTNNLQEIAPMSRFLNRDATRCRTTSSGCYRHSLDAISIYANANNTDGNGSGACDTVAYSKTLTTSTGTYAIDDWRSVLRLIYGGMEPQIINYDPCTDVSPPRTAIASKDCNSPARLALINSWGNLFQNTCGDTDCTQLKHAFRRDDASGSTDVFLELLGLPAITATPFCNGSETQDADPVRRTCEGTGRNANDGEQVCRADGTLGIVLALLIPPTDPYVTGGAPRDRGGVDCGTSWEADQVAPFCSTSGAGGTFQRISMPAGVTSCPVGTFISGTCLWPKRTGSAANTGFDCIVSKGNLPGSITPGTDARAWNTMPLTANGLPLAYKRSTAPLTRPMISAYYRLHMTSQQNGGDRPSVTVGTATRTQGCAFADSTEQIGCLVEASPCSIGYAGLSAENPNPECGSTANRRTLALETPAGGGVTAAPSKLTARRFLDPIGNGCAAAGDYDLRYSLTRGLWLCTEDGVPTASGTGTTTGSQSVTYLQQQNALASCFQSRAIVDEAANATGFITLDDTGTAPISFFACTP